MKITPIPAPSNSLSPHPHSLLLPRMGKEDFLELVRDIRDNGLQQPIVLYQGKILDGNHRYNACDVAPKERSFVEFEGTDSEAQAYVISANIHRRHLTQEQRRELIAKLLKADPSKSDRQIGATAKADNKTVAAVRGKLEATEEIPQLTATTGADGKKRKRKGKPNGTGKSKTKIEYQDVVNIKTALNAYSVLEQHLLDALQDVSLASCSRKRRKRRRSEWSGAGLALRGACSVPSLLRDPHRSRNEEGDRK